MGRTEKPTFAVTMCTPTIGGLLRYLRNERELSLIEMAKLTNFSKGHLSNLENGKASKISKDILEKYEKILGFKAHEIGAFFLLLRTETIPIGSRFADVLSSDRHNAMEIAREIDCFPQLLESVSVFIKKVGCGLSDYIDLYQAEVIAELKQHSRPSLVEFKLRAFLENYSGRNL